ncbi:MAG TPA: hypothetical protein VG892_07655 [Terriglobales bacterium]|nr:hypothetical protein [Terriglobales bacterium]
MTDTTKLPAGLIINRYEHGGARVYWDRDGKRDLIMDLYDEEPGTRTDAIIELVLKSGILK